MKRSLIASRNSACLVALALSCWSFTFSAQSGGQTVGWGWNASGQTNVPADLTQVVAIAAGGAA